MEYTDRPKCKGFIRASGAPCTQTAVNKITEGYCICHDPGITKEMRAKWTRDGLTGQKVFHKPTRKLRNISEIIGWLEQVTYEFAKLNPVYTVEVVQVYVDLAKVLISALRERDTGEKSKKIPAGWRASG